MGNINTIAVAVLTDGGCIVLAVNANIDGPALDKSVEQGVTVLKASMPIFEAALAAHKLLNGE
jgi:hypothetical protein